MCVDSDSRDSAVLRKGGAEVGQRSDRRVDQPILICVQLASLEMTTQGASFFFFCLEVVSSHPPDFTVTSRQL